MTVVGLRLWGWVITLSPPSSNHIGRRSLSLGCQLPLKALLTQRCSFCLFISLWCLYFPDRRVWQYLCLKHNIVFHFGKEIKSFFFLSPLAKDTIPSGESYVYLLPQCRARMTVFYGIFKIFKTLFIPSTMLWWQNYKVVKNKQGQREQIQGEFVVNWLYLLLLFPPAWIISMEFSLGLQELRITPCALAHCQHVHSKHI